MHEFLEDIALEAIGEPVPPAKNIGPIHRAVSFADDSYGAYCGAGRAPKPYSPRPMLAFSDKYVDCPACLAALAEARS